MKTIPSGFFTVTRGARRMFLRLPLSAADYTHAFRHFLTDRLGRRWTVGKRIG